MNTFDDLKFEPHPITFGKMARMTFENGYGVSVVVGEIFYSNGFDNFELAVINPAGGIDYTTELTDNVLGYQTKDEITAAMAFVQSLPKLTK